MYIAYSLEVRIEKEVWPSGRQGVIAWCTIEYERVKRKEGRATPRAGGILLSQVWNKEEIRREVEAGIVGLQWKVIIWIGEYFNINSFWHVCGQLYLKRFIKILSKYFKKEKWGLRRVNSILFSVQFIHRSHKVNSCTFHKKFLPEWVWCYN